MTSRFGVLYQQARNTVTLDKSGAFRRPKRIENLLTEMLSLAVLADRGPMEKLLATFNLVGDHRPIARIRPYTQQQVLRGLTNEDRARVDLVLAIDGEDDSTSEVWLEVKAGSHFHGDQIGRYLTAMKEAQDGIPRRLAVLGPSWIVIPEAFRPCVPLLRWEDLVRTIQGLPDSSLWWDLSNFLVEAPGELLPRLQEPADALPLEWIAEAVAVALVDPVAWCHARTGRDRPSIARSVLTIWRNNQRDLRQPCVQRWAPWQITCVMLGSSREHRDSLFVSLYMPTMYGIPYEVLWRRAKDSGLTQHGWHLGRRREEAAILTITRSFSKTETAEKAGKWLREQLEILEDKGLLPNLDGDGRVRGDTEWAPAPGAVTATPLATDCGTESAGTNVTTDCAKVKRPAAAG